MQLHPAGVRVAVRQKIVHVKYERAHEHEDVGASVGYEQMALFYTTI
jgi:hypothetical protein